MRRALQSILLVLLIASAGCIGDGGGGTPDVDGTETPANTATTTAGAPDSPPGVSESGVEDPEAILEAHKSQLQDRFYTARTNRTTVAANGSVRSNETPWTFQIGEPGAGTLVTIDPDGPGVTERWYNESIYVVNATRSNGESTYQRKPPSTIPQPIHQVQYEDLENASVGENTTTDRVTRDGRELVRIRGLTFDEPGTEHAGELSMLVESNGLIREYTKNTTQSPGDSEDATTVVYEIRIESIEESGGPDRPAWVATAIDETQSYEG